MGFTLWTMIAVVSVAAISMVIFSVHATHVQKMKRLEIEALKAEKANVQNQVDDSVARQLRDVIERVEVLEAIVTDKERELNEKIANLTRSP